MKNQIHLFYKRRFWPLFVAQFCGAFNDNFFKQGIIFVLTYGAIVTADKSANWINLASSLFIVPFFLFSAISGELADKYEKSYILRLVKLIEIALIAFIAYGLYFHSLPMLLTAVFLFGLHATVFGPAKYAILPELLQEDELIAGNAFLESSTFIAILIGMMGSYVITHQQYGTLAAVIIMGVFAVIGFLASNIIPKSKIEHPKLAINLNFISSTTSIIQYARSNRTVWLSILGISWFWLIGYVVITQFPIFVRDYLQAPSIVVNFCLGMFTIGFLSGALICNYILDSRIEATYVPVGVFGLSIFLIDLYFASHGIGTVTGVKSFFEWTTIRFAIDLLMMSFCGGIFIIPLYTFLQTKSEEDHRSRVIAANNILNSLFMLLGGILYYLLSKLSLSTPEMVLLLGICNLFVGICTLGLLPDVLLKGVIRWALKRLYQVEVHHLEQYPNANERCIIVANHQSYLDILLLCAFLPDKFSIGIDQTLADAWWAKPFLLLADRFIIDSRNPMSTRTIIDKIKSGKRCIIFPEGQLGTSAAIMKIYETPGLIAERAGAYIQPIRIHGAQSALGFSKEKGKVRLRLFPKISLNILPKIRLQALGINVSPRERRRQYSMHLYRLTREMMFETANYQITLYQALIDAMKVYGKKHPIAEDLERKTLNYRQFILRTLILSRHIKKRSKFNEIIGLLLPTTNTSNIAFFSLQAIGRIPAMLNFSTGIKNLLHTCKIANIKQVYTSRKFIQSAKIEAHIKVLEENQIQIHYLEELRNDIRLIHKLIGSVRFIAVEHFYKRIGRKIRTTDPAALLFTSGSEGIPKAVVLSHQNILANCYQLKASVDFGPKDIVFNALPVFHSFGLTVGAILPMMSGLKVFSYPSPLHYRVVPELVYDSNATILFGTDTFLAGYARYAHNYDFYSIRYIFAGAEKLKTETYRIYSEKFGSRIFEGYGATETSPVISSNTPMENKLGTVGRLMPGIKYRIENVEGIKQGGRLYVKGPNIMLGYLNDDQSIKSLPDGWYDTGDIVAIDADGYIQIIDRAKRFAKIGGEMVSLTAIEHAVSEIWPEEMHACSSIADAKKGEQIILLTTRSKPNYHEIVKAIREKGYTELFVPKQVIHVLEIPLLTSGKVDHMKLKTLIGSLLTENAPSLSEAHVS